LFSHPLDQKMTGFIDPDLDIHTHAAISVPNECMICIISPDASCFVEDFLQFLQRFSFDSRFKYIKM
jgi:hypothetical protein